MAAQSATTLTSVTPVGTHAACSDRSAAPSGARSLLFGPGQSLVFAGASITEAGCRSKQWAPYGSGYVHLVRTLLVARYPVLHLRVVNAGESGNTVHALEKRWRRDVLDERPDWISVQIGGNDGRQHVDRRLGDARPVEQYEQTYQHLLSEARDRTGAGLILIEPHFVAPPAGADPFAGAVDPHCGWTLAHVRQTYPALRRRRVDSGPEHDACQWHFRAVMDQYVAAVRRLAAEFGAVLVQAQEAFDEAMRGEPPAFWSHDGVHPTTPGHAVLARAFLRATGYGDV
ncbi:MAG: SGNH/GDSL hydrolase family protein [Chloroflexota bacterium]|nr:SGNH/GDSL hydrolase family protein [Chloroflexota bacterium]